MKIVEGWKFLRAFRGGKALFLIQVEIYISHFALSAGSQRLVLSDVVTCYIHLTHGAGNVVVQLPRSRHMNVYFSHFADDLQCAVPVIGINILEIYVVLSHHILDALVLECGAVDIFNTVA